MDLETYAKLTREQQLEHAVQEVAHYLLAANVRVPTPDEWRTMTARQGSSDTPHAAE